jgi:hypothetical protein
VFDDAQLLRLAGKAAFARGRAYCAEGRVELDECGDDRLAGEAQGTRRYAFVLERAGGDWRWSCGCPAADDGSFCKHLVAAVLAARADATTAADGARRAKAAPPRDDLCDWLRAQPAPRLVGWLAELAADDREIDRRLRLHRAAEDPSTLKAALAKTLAAGGFLDYRASLRYARRLETAIGLIAAQLERNAESCRGLCEYALGRLFGIHERSDDSAGAIGAQVGELAELYARACALSRPGKALAKPLFALSVKDSWGAIPLAAFRDPLGSEGLAA